MPSPRVRRPATALLAVTLLTALAGCGGGSDRASGPGSPTPSPITPSATVLPPSPSAPPSTTPTQTATPPGLASRLLDAGAVPELDSGSAWREGRTLRADAKPFGVCQRFDLVSIGATRVVERRFTPAAGGPASAAEQIASFPDAENTQRARAVLAAWHDRCTSQVGPVSHLKLQPATDVPVTTGTGSWYLVSYQPRSGGARELHATGIVVAGTTIALLRMDSRGQDQGHAAGGEPMVRAVQAAADKLG